MKKLFPFITLLALSLISTGAVIKESKQGGSIEFYTNESGTVVKKAEITAAGKMKVDQIENLSGGTPPGMIPIGGMVAVMPTIHANAWQPPVSGAIKDGFMRADGWQITAQNVTDGSLIPAGTYLPNMVYMVPRGDTDSCNGSSACNTKTGGSDNATLTMNNIPEHNHGATGLSGSMAASEFEHSHSLSGSVAGGTASLTGSITSGGASLSGSVSGGTASGTFASSGHTHGLASGAAAIGMPGNTTGYLIFSRSGQAFTGSYYASMASAWASTGDSHLGTNLIGTTDANTATASVSSTAASNGTLGVSYTAPTNGTLAVSNTPANNGTLAVGADNITTARSVGISGNTANAGQASPTAVDTLPNYQKVVWVIRVY